ncbi:hypothetical protein [Lysobacter humi (ex Lee et al. 2017)]
MRILLLCLALLATPALADGFTARVARAKAAVATPAGYAYDMALVPAIHAAMTGCVPAGRAPAKAADVFTAVADVDASGRVHVVDVRPATPIARCFAKRLGAVRLQRPPGAQATTRHPIVIELRETF